MLFCQLYYWRDITTDPEGWIYKTAEEWRTEITLSKGQQLTARKKLKDLGILEEKNERLIHRLSFRLNTVILDKLLAQHAAENAKDSPGETTDFPKTGFAISGRSTEDLREGPAGNSVILEQRVQKKKSLNPFLAKGT